jgi:hypothetical protein
MQKLIGYNDFVEIVYERGVINLNVNEQLINRLPDNYVIIEHNTLGLMFIKQNNLKVITRPISYFNKFKDLSSMVEHEISVARDRQTARNKIVKNVPIVRTIRNTILQMQYEKRNRSLWSNLSPMSFDKHIGIELEIISKEKEGRFLKMLNNSMLKPYVSLAEDSSIEVYNNDLCDCGYDEEDGHGEDCSVYNGDYAIELRLLLKENELPRVMKLLDNFLKSTDCYVNETCGLHVHLDMRTRDVHNSYSNLFKSLDEICSKIDSSRLTNRFCRRNLRDDFDQQDSLDDRYFMINTRSYEEHSTLEIRAHEGTTDVDKISNWINFLISTVDNTSNNENLSTAV